MCLQRIKHGIKQSCGSGSGRILNFWQDPDKNTDPGKNIPDPDSSGSEMNLK